MSVYIHSDSIASPLGIGSELNFNRVLNGDSGIKKHHNNSISSTPFFAAVVSDELLCQSPGSKINPKQWSNFTKLEKMLLLSIEDALSASTIRANDSKTILIFTTTKGNIDLLTNGLSGNVFLFKLAQKIGETLANPNPVLTVSNACISGLSGLIAASRLINSGRFDHAIVFGGDLVSEFTFSGFTSFKAISPEPCKPYDQARLGINLGEAAATLVLSKLPSPVSLLNGAVSNDANHISGPSRTGEGLQIAINQTLKYSGVSPNQIGFVSLHGTATSYNDEMECQALNAMQLESIPSHSLKGFFGHTLGAAGLVESALCVQMLKSGKTIPCHGFSEPGTTLPMNIETNSGLLKGDYILKTASGFGGCNAAILLAKSQPNPTDFHPIRTEIPPIRFSVQIEPGSISFNNQLLFSEPLSEGVDAWLNLAFRTLTPGYLKFFKMDKLSKLGFLAMSLAMRDFPLLEKYKSEEIALVFANSSSSLDTDLLHQSSLNDKSNYFPSPAVFVYTLPNIVMGEVAIKFGIKGENIFLLSESFSELNLRTQCELLFSQTDTKLAIVAWIELLNDNFICKLGICEKPFGI